jgi:hypothetical protein
MKRDRDTGWQLNLNSALTNQPRVGLFLNRNPIVNLIVSHFSLHFLKAPLPSDINHREFIISIPEIIAINGLVPCARLWRRL